jgi:hypothetical protein
MLIQNRELEELQRRILEAERRLQSQSTGSDNTSSQLTGDKASQLVSAQSDLFCRAD